MADVKDLGAALQDVRKMNRSLRLRKESDPEVVAETLSTILREAIAVRSASGGRLGKGAVNEIRNIRRALIAGQIDSGQRSTEFIGKYSAILDQISGAEKQSREEAKKSGPGVGQSIANSLPSADMITSALITANPILGYTTKIAKDALTSTKQRRQAQREEERKRIELLNQEEDKLEEESQNVEQGSPQEAEILGKLEMIREEIQKLTAIWTDGDEKLERIVNETSESNRLEREASSRESLMRSERAYEGPSFGAGVITADVADEAQAEAESAFDGQAGMFAGIGGAIGGAASGLAQKLLAPFVGLMNFIRNGGSILGRLGRVSGLITAAYAIYDFVDGFMSAEDILDKETSEISITDKIRAGAASVVSGLLTPVDWVLDFFDLGFMEDKDSFTKKLANSESELFQFFLSPGSWVVDYVTNFDWSETFKKIKDSIGGAVEEIGNFFSSIGEAISDWIDDKIEWFNDTWIGKQIKDIVDSLSTDNNLSGAVNEFGGYYRGAGSDLQALQERRTQLNESPSISSDALTSALGVVDKQLVVDNSGGGNTVVAPNNSSSTIINQNVSGGSSARDEDESLRRFRSPRDELRRY